MSEQSRHIQIVNRKGLHARASAKLAELALTLPTKVTVSFEGESADARSIMDLLCLGAGIGNTVELTAEGDDAVFALDSVENLFADGFGELAEDAACACK
ncbi:MAG: HPr family phosphocarrier protein [Henriciella sp.]|jgi:phosphocarrier protein|mmetsp:Transcript_27820/g.35916  ORF Transcript_27820/g.35916 Transcript_27820/m.35916 type:complete len:100 (-) Transcript_27820:306-605(-)